MNTNDTLIDGRIGSFRDGEGRIKLFRDTVARPMIGGRWALMNRQETGLASSALIFATLDQIKATFAVVFGERSTDKYGEFVRVHRVSEVVEMRDAPIPEHTCCPASVRDGYCTLCGEKYIALKGPVMGIQGQKGF